VTNLERGGSVGASIGAPSVHAAEAECREVRWRNADASTSFVCEGRAEVDR
jgi:hypothetical protein